MNLKEFHFLLLTGKLGDPDRKPLSMAEIRHISHRIQLMTTVNDDADLTDSDLAALGLDDNLRRKILSLLESEQQLRQYLRFAEKLHCFPLMRTEKAYPVVLRERLQLDVPGCLWYRGDPDLLAYPAISLVGSRDILVPNKEFAREVGRQAAIQGYALVSGNARGADLTAQNACLEAGGCVISLVADRLMDHPTRQNILYVSAEDFDAPFSTQRAFQRNTLIHAFGKVTFVAQAKYGTGGSWHGSVQNLRKKLSPVMCYDDGSEATKELEKLGAQPVSLDDLQDIDSLIPQQYRLF